jgi:hypothetical protein
MRDLKCFEQGLTETGRSTNVATASASGIHPVHAKSVMSIKNEERLEPCGLHCTVQLLSANGGVPVPRSRLLALRLSANMRCRQLTSMENKKIKAGQQPAGTPPLCEIRGCFYGYRRNHKVGGREREW